MASWNTSAAQAFLSFLAYFTIKTTFIAAFGLYTTAEEPLSYNVFIDVDPRRGVLGSEFTFTANVSSTIPNSAVQTHSDMLCCTYIFEDDTSSEVLTVFAGSSVTVVKSVPASRLLPAGTYRMNITACLHSNATVEERVLLPVASNTTRYHLTDQINGYMAVKQNIFYQTNWSTFETNKPLCFYFYLTDHLFGSFTYHWQINGTTGSHTDMPLLLYKSPAVGLTNFRLHVEEARTGRDGQFNSLVLFQDAITSATVSGDKRTLMNDLTKLVLHFNGSGPIKFCWTLLTPDAKPVCIEDIMGPYSFTVQPDFIGSLVLLGNVSNYISWKKFEFTMKVLPRVNINSVVLVPVLIVAVFMSAIMSYLVFRSCCRAGNARTVEEADFDFHPELTAEIEKSSSTVHRCCPALYRLARKVRTATGLNCGKRRRRSRRPRDQLDDGDTVRILPAHSSRKRSLSVPALDGARVQNHGLAPGPGFTRQQSQSMTDLESISES